MRNRQAKKIRREIYEKCNARWNIGADCSKCEYCSKDKGCSQADVVDGKLKYDKRQIARNGLAAQRVYITRYNNGQVLESAGNGALIPMKVDRHLVSTFGPLGEKK